MDRSGTLGLCTTFTLSQETVRKRRDLNGNSEEYLRLLNISQ